METETEPCSPRRSCGARSSTSSPEFEFWMVNNHPELEPNLHTADELFVDGVLLPLHNLSVSSHPPPPPPPNSTSVDVKQQNQEGADQAESSILSSSTPSPSSGSKRWKDIFKKKEVSENNDKDKKKERKSGGSGGGNGTTELNINIWPFSRSRSAGRVKPAASAMRKSSSAPCSRSNSRGERRWAASPGRPGIHVGRASPVWQVKRAEKGHEHVSGPGSGPREKGRRGMGGGARGLNLNVNGCIGYRNQGRCRGEGNDGNNNGSLFRFKALFAKKVY